jgi:aryl-alcohol dehydrogenase-like predicted oxidoreductase
LKLALGTVQFGLPYGIANRQGQVAPADARAILDYAVSIGIDTLDTAAVYGDSEQRLGEIGVQTLKIISKLPPIPDKTGDVGHWVRTTVEKSLELLRIRQLAGLLLHHPADLLGENGAQLHRALLDVQAAGLVRKIGVSVYRPAELDELIGRFPIEIVQAPFNVLDRRILTSGWLARLHGLGIEVHVRSVFLQGLLLLDRLARPPQFNRWQEIWQDWDEYLLASNQTPLEACVRFASSSPTIARVVVGIDSRRQLEEIFGALDGATVSLPYNLQCNDPHLLEPSRWKSLTPAAG